MSIIGGDDVVNALEKYLRTAIPEAQKLLGYEELGDIQDWQVLPDREAIAAANYPAISIAAPTAVAGDKSRSGYAAMWDVSIAVIDRDNDHQPTQNRVQRWAKVIRVAILRHTSIPGTRIQMTWTGEDTNLFSGMEDARTLGGAEVMFDAFVEHAMDLDEIRNPGGMPLVESTHHTLTNLT